MNVLSVENLSKSFGEKVLFSNLSFGVSQGEKTALVARNGTGKTTLLNILKGKDIADEGIVTFSKGIRVAFLEQEPLMNANDTIMEVLLASDNQYTKAVHDYTRALDKVEQHFSEQHQMLLDQATTAMNELNAWDYEAKVKEILSRLDIHDVERKISQLSGGQKKRVALAQVLISEPDFLILDEPTNHLDVEMIEWLEDYLISKDLSLLLVTHDRYFLDNICTRIFELEDKTLYTYNGNFEYYLTKKEERTLAQASEIDKARNIYRKELEWMRKMPKARGTKAKARITSFYEIEQIAKQKKQDRQVELSVKMTRLGSKILELIKISKSYGEKKLFEGFTYTFKKSEKIGIVGKNGSGKSTLIRIILGEEPYDSGKIQTGETVVFGHFSQGGMQLKDDKRVIETIKDIAEFIPMANGTHLSASQLLTRFNFPPDVQYSFVSKLSGGEKRRLYLCTVLIKNPNFLILDEPTNDLDIVTLQSLEEFLMEFQGCVLIVSHDRYFMDKLVDHVFVFEGGTQIRDFPGNYTEYRIAKDEEDRKKRETEKQLSMSSKPISETTTLSSPKVEEQSKRKRSFKEQFELEQLEKEIPELENKKSELENILSDGSVTDHLELQKITEEFGKVSGDLDAKTLRWLELSELG